MKIGITGQQGFIGTHLYNFFGLCPEIERVHFDKNYFQQEEQLRNFVKECDVIIHLAAVNRGDPHFLYQTNVGLVMQLIAAMEKEQVNPYILFSSSTQETIENPYGKSKREGSRLLKDWAKRNNASFTSLVIPNVFGPFGKPNYNSFIATFCHQLTHNDQPIIHSDNSIPLIYSGSLCSYIYCLINDYGSKKTTTINRVKVPYDFEMKVSEVLALLESYRDQYLNCGIIPAIGNTDELNLFNTFCGYIDYEKHFPVLLKSSADNRGIFVETLKSSIGGQFSFSTTKPNIIRGEHYHTRKIERFIVVKGKALIQLRKIGADEILNFEMDGELPAYVDIPVWYTHNIKNTGEEDLYTQFWISEWYDPTDSDTYFEPVNKMKE